MPDLISRSPARVHVAGRAFDLPWHPAAVWIEHRGRLHVLVARLARAEDVAAMADLVTARGSTAERDMRAESLRILSEATGRPWWESGRLIATATDPAILGRLVLAGVDPWTRSVGEWCAAVYALCTKNADTQALIKFDFQLSIPPPGEEDGWDDGVDPASAMQAIADMKRGR